MTECFPAPSRDSRDMAHPRTRRLGGALPIERREGLAEEGLGEGFGKPTPPTGEQPSATRAPQADAADPGGASDGKEGDSRGPRKPLSSPVPPNQGRESSRREERTMAKATRRRRPSPALGAANPFRQSLFRARVGDGRGRPWRARGRRETPPVVLQSCEWAAR
jgi:hypothetical protein